MPRLAREVSRRHRANCILFSQKCDRLKQGNLNILFSDIPKLSLHHLNPDSMALTIATADIVLMQNQLQDVIKSLELNSKFLSRSRIKRVAVSFSPS
ncbi:MAG: hypothetical protein ACRCZS_28005 [Chroococcidiopsis sp.]